MRNKFKHRRKIFKKRTRPGKTERAAARTSQNKKTTQIGELKLHRNGYGFVLASRRGEEDIFVPARFMGDALNGDLVEVKVIPGRQERFEGRIIRIAERRVSKLVGRLERHANAYQVVIDDRSVRHRMLVLPKDIGSARPGDNVIAEIKSYPEGDRAMVGVVSQVLGARGEEETEKTAIITRHHLEREFPKSAREEAARTAMQEGDLEGRRDLRSVPFVTIDGETAKDFDDALAVERTKGSAIKLYVSIADVSHFVRPNTALDRAAFERGTSVYFPNDCIPMLPEALSNDLCSLRPREDRLTMTAEMDVGLDGRILRSSFYKSVINSRERMTYTSVKKLLVENDLREKKRYQNLISDFELMKECYERLKRNRQRRGSIDFDLPEPFIEIDMQGEVSDIVRAERHLGHMMIEDFMIAANESVAEFLTRKNCGCVYRIHEPPPSDKLREFQVLLHNLGHRINFDKDVAPAALAKIVNLVRERPEERLVNHMLLRSMSQAIYSPENKGHFGLASKCYCHFTSPIRRYPDLVVHRLLKQAISKSAGRMAARGLQEISEHCSRRERVAMEAERETAKFYAALFMQDRIGAVLNGIISHMGKFGFFVELEDIFVEGLVLMESLGDDRYKYEESGMQIRGAKKRKIFKIGDRVQVEVREVDIPNRQILFTLC